VAVSWPSDAVSSMSRSCPRMRSERTFSAERLWKLHLLLLALVSFTFFAPSKCRCEKRLHYAEIYAG
jgi:hypothetical protein